MQQINHNECNKNNEDPHAERRDAQFTIFIFLQETPSTRQGNNVEGFRKAKPLILPDCDARRNGEKIISHKIFFNVSARSTQTFAYRDEERIVQWFIYTNPGQIRESIGGSTVVGKRSTRVRVIVWEVFR